MLWPEDQRLATLYDIKCAGRQDHDFYLALADQLEARSVLDLGCGTGVFAIDVVHAGSPDPRRVVGVDPAAVIVDIARTRHGGDTVTWIHGTAADVNQDPVDLVIMMGHVAQYFVTDEAWTSVLAQCFRLLTPGGSLAFEVRNPDRGWPRRWTESRTKATLAHPDGGHFVSWVQSVALDGPPTSFTETHEGHTVLANGDHLVSSETLRFRSPQEVTTSVEQAGFTIVNTWGDWDSSAFDPVDSDELIVQAQRP